MYEPTWGPGECRKCIRDLGTRADLRLQVVNTHGMSFKEYLKEYGDKPEPKKYHKPTLGEF